MTARTRRVIAYVVLVAFAGVGIFRVEQATDDLHGLVRDEAREDRVDDAQWCVSSWEVREQIRASDRRHGLAAGEALIEVVQPDDQALVDLYRAVLAQHLQRASAEIDDPDCDLDRARAVLDQE